MKILIGVSLVMSVSILCASSFAPVYVKILCSIATAYAIVHME